MLLDRLFLVLANARQRYCILCKLGGWLLRMGYTKLPSTAYAGKTRMLTILRARAYFRRAKTEFIFRLACRGRTVPAQSCNLARPPWNHILRRGEAQFYALPEHANERNRQPMPKDNEPTFGTHALPPSQSSPKLQRTHVKSWFHLD